MFSTVLSYWFGWISSWIAWLFTLQINSNPDISLGMFLIACFFLGLIIKFILGTDFVLPFTGGKSSDSSNNYVPRHEYHPRHGRKE